MELLKTVFPLLGVLIGWLLSESGKIFADKRQDKRKLKKLLFFLLELRFHFSKELSFELEFDKSLDLLKTKFATKLGVDKNEPELNLVVNNLKPQIEAQLIKYKTQDSKFEYFTENIDKILIELAEILPIIAYELSGQHNIKERLNKMDSLFSEFETITEDAPFDIKKWMNPKLTKELLDDLDESIEKVAKRIDEKTDRESKEKIVKMTSEDNTMGDFIEEYLEKALENLPKQ